MLRQKTNQQLMTKTLMAIGQDKIMNNHKVLLS